MWNDLEGLKAKARDAIENSAGELNELSQDIWKHPELCFQEHHAHNVLTDFLEAKGFEVERKCILDTAFRATCGGREKPHISVLCEYDALPEIGHACGHNLIAEVGVAAGLGIKAAMQAAGKELGKLTIVGCPAEEGGGGKIDLIKGGMFANMDASLMAHPSNINESSPVKLAKTGVLVTFRGKACHASAFPWEGINAVDAAVLAYSNVSVLRQQMKPLWRICGIFSSGGAKPNIIPDYAQVNFYMRAPTDAELAVLQKKFTACCDAAALATGCTVEFTWDSRPYASLVSNRTLTSLYEENSKQLGVEFFNMGYTKTGSTDMGNVSQLLPGIHPDFYVGTDEPTHSVKFNTASGVATAQPFTLRTAKALAMMALDIYCKEDVLKKMKADFADDAKKASMM